MPIYQWFGSWTPPCTCAPAKVASFGASTRRLRAFSTCNRWVKDQLPILQTAQVREVRGGIPTMTADGQHILGPAPGVEGFYFASGCNVAGLSISPTLGEALATWIVDGKPPVDLSPMSCMRFKDKSWSEAQLQREAAWQYRHFYGAVEVPARDGI